MIGNVGGHFSSPHPGYTMPSRALAGAPRSLTNALEQVQTKAVGAPSVGRRGVSQTAITAYAFETSGPRIHAPGTAVMHPVSTASRSIAKGIARTSNTPVAAARQLFKSFEHLAEIDRARSISMTPRTR